MSLQIGETADAHCCPLTGSLLQGCCFDAWCPGSGFARADRFRCCSILCTACSERSTLTPGLVSADSVTASAVFMHSDSGGVSIQHLHLYAPVAITGSAEVSTNTGPVTINSLLIDHSTSYTFAVQTTSGAVHIIVTDFHGTYVIQTESGSLQVSPPPTNPTPTRAEGTIGGGGNHFLSVDTASGMAVWNSLSPRHVHPRSATGDITVSFTQ